MSNILVSLSGEIYRSMGEMTVLSLIDGKVESREVFANAAGRFTTNPTGLAPINAKLVLPSDIPNMVDIFVSDLKVAVRGEITNWWVELKGKPFTGMAVGKAGGALAFDNGKPIPAQGSPSMTDPVRKTFEVVINDMRVEIGLFHFGEE